MDEIDLERELLRRRLLCFQNVSCSGYNRITTKSRKVEVTLCCCEIFVRSRKLIYLHRVTLLIERIYNVGEAPYRQELIEPRLTERVVTSHFNSLR